MNNFMVCLNAVLPIFLTILIGFIARTVGVIKREDIDKFNKVVFVIFMPVLVFNNIYGSDLSAAVQPKLIIYSLSATMFSFLIAYLPARREKQPQRRSVTIQAIYRSNFVIIGLPIAASLLGDHADLGPIAFMIATVVPLYNILAVIILAYYSGESVSARNIAAQIAKNPIILGSVVGLLFVAFGITLPTVIAELVDDFSGVASPLALILLGAFIDPKMLKSDLKSLGIICVFRLVILPAIILSLACFLGFRGVELVGLIGMCAAPTAIASFTMAQQMGADADLACGCVVLTSALCSFTLFAWCLLFKSLGMI